MVKGANGVDAGNGISCLTMSGLEGAASIRHAFTTRLNGLGRRGEFRSPSDWDPVAASFGIPSSDLATVHQVHGDDIVRVDRGRTGEARARQADGLVTNVPGIAIGIETADCVPILLADPGVPAVAAVHAGWRSTVLGIARKAVRTLAHEYGADPQRIIAGIGPAIGPECYEVDEPVMGPLRAAFPFWREAVSARGRDRWSLDLAKVNRLALAQAGLKERNIHSIGLCTACDRERFYSFRAEGRTGRMLSVIMIR